MGIQPLMRLPALAVTTIRATRDFIADLLLLKPDGNLSLLIHGTFELPLSLRLPVLREGRFINGPDKSHVVGLAHPVYSSVSLQLSDGTTVRVSLDLIPRDHLVSDCLLMLSFVLPPDMFFALHRDFIAKWAEKDYSFIIGAEFKIFETSLLQTLGLEADEPIHPQLAGPGDPWNRLAATESFDKFREDPVLRRLQLPGPRPVESWRKASSKPHPLVGAVLHALHLIAEEKRVFLPSYEGLPRLTPLICRLAMIVRPEWADYWKRFCPSAMQAWPIPSTTGNS